MLAALGCVTTGLLAGCGERTDTGSTPSSTDQAAATSTDQAPTASSTTQPTTVASTDRTTTSTDEQTTASSTDQPTETAEAAYYVSPDGDDENRGTRDSPIATVTEGVNRAQPGETVQVAPGEYTEAIVTVRDGAPDAPITIRGPADAVIRPPPETYSAVTIRHHHTHLRGMTITGLIDPERKFDDWRAWAANCVLINPSARADAGVDYIRGAVVEPSRAGNTGRALIQTVRIRDAVIGNFEVTGPTGMRYDPRVANHEIGHVGEIVYVGSPETVRTRESHPYDTLDRSRNIRIHHIDNSAGYSHNEFVEVKLGSTNVTVEYCTDRNAGHNTEGLVEPAILIAGNDCTVRWNDVGSCPVPIGFNAWTPTGDIDPGDWAQNNAVYGNHIHGFAAGALRFPVEDDVGIRPADQRVLCGNRIERGDPPVEPWVPEANGFDGQIADRRGQDEVRVAVGAGPDGHAFDPPAVIVDPGTTITWDWVEDSGAHYVVSRVRVTSDPDDVPDPVSGPNSTSETVEAIGMTRYACYEHHDEGMRSAVVVAAEEGRYAYATGECDESIPSVDEVGHTGGNTSET
jgi:halocyanin-like protein